MALGITFGVRRALHGFAFEMLVDKTWPASLVVYKLNRLDSLSRCLVFLSLFSVENVLVNAGLLHG